MQTAERQEYSIDQDIALLTVQTWKESPALSRWFKGGLYQWYEHLACYDIGVAQAVCSAHLAAKGCNRLVGTTQTESKQENTTDAVASSESESYLTAWYGRIVCKLYLLNASHVWPMCYLAATIY